MRSLTLPNEVRALVNELRDIRKRIRRLERLEGGTTNLVNNSRGPLSPGDVVVMDAGVENAVTWAGGAAVQGPMVVVVGGVEEELVKCTKRGYGKIEVVCEGAAISPGDAIVTAATNGRGQVDNTATVRNLVGFALESKGAGVVASIEVLV